MNIRKVSGDRVQGRAIDPETGRDSGPSSWARVSQVIRKVDAGPFKMERVREKFDRRLYEATMRNFHSKRT